MNQAINDRIIELLHKRLRQEALTGEEQKELQQWIDLSPENELLFRELTDEQSLSGALEKFGNIDTEASLQQVRQRIFVGEEAEELPTIQTNQIPWWRRNTAAAAIILILLMAGGTAIYFSQQQADEIVSNEKTIEPTKLTESILPGGDKTRLTLSNGSIIDLDVSQNGDLAVEESAIIHGEKLLYDIANANKTAGEAKLNTLANPRGLKQKVVLPDQSIIWLNSVSAIWFPTKFSSTERRIYLTGEAEFEITKDASKPFIVQTVSELAEPKGTAVRVLGTHFNITAYDNEAAITTTLMEGSVEVSNKVKIDTLAPNQQAVVSGNTIIKKAVDVKTYEAHKAGKYDFKDAPLKSILNQVERMYKVKVIYNNTNPLSKALSHTLVQDEKLTDLIEILNELSGDVECKLSADHTKLTVSDKN